MQSLALKLLSSLESIPKRYRVNLSSTPYSGGIPETLEVIKLGVLVNLNDLDKTTGAIIDLFQNKSKSIESEKMEETAC